MTGLTHTPTLNQKSQAISHGGLTGLNGAHGAQVNHVPSLERAAVTELYLTLVSMWRCEPNVNIFQLFQEKLQNPDFYVESQF